MHVEWVIKLLLSKEYYTFLINLIFPFYCTFYSYCIFLNMTQNVLC